MHGGVVGIHSAEKQRNELQQRQQNIDPVQQFRGGGCFRNQLAQGGAGTFGPDEMGSPPGQLRQPGKRQHQDAHSADPVGRRAPEHDAPGEMLKIRRDGSAGRRQAGNGLKKRVLKTGKDPGKQKGKRTENAQQDPSEGRNDISFFQTEVGAGLVFRKKAHKRPEGGGQQETEPEGPRITILINKGDDQGREHRHRLDQQQGAEHPDDQFPVH